MISTFQYISCCYLSKEVTEKERGNKLFQYISCCYLSKTYCTILASSGSFNTSHVVIYPDLLLKATTTLTFQYISCCYLSHKAIYYIFASFKFQYISCCYLSEKRNRKSAARGGFNTSHVVIYQNKNNSFSEDL